MIRIQQEHQFGCAIAVTAMILGVEYQSALALFLGHPDIQLGYGCHVTDSILIEHGYALGRKYKTTRPGNTLREIWPVEPWGKVHWCEVMTQAGAHAIIMLEDGTVLDPHTPDRTRLDHPDYLSVNFVAAVVKI